MTKREFEILQHFAKGYREKEIAELHNLSYRTIQSHIRKVKENYEACSIPHLIAICYKEGIFNDENELDLIDNVPGHLK